ncbi:MAG TPA: 50S ribosomal protein L6 [bacterium]|nr:50S ribosomal protein L6 [bacterium]
MSRIGKKPINIPEGVDVKINDNLVIIKGPKGELSQEIRPEIKVDIDKNEIKVSVKDEKKLKESKAFWGLFRVLLANMIEGVTKGFEKKLKIEGVGYKVNLDGEDIVLNIGFSHPVKVSPYPDIKFSVGKNEIVISGINKQKVGELAAKIRKIKKPDAYKGKGIRYIDEIVKKKPGKKAATST